MSTEKSWQSRIGESADALARSFVESVSYDRRLYKHDVAGSVAHAAMLARVGLITEQEREQIVAGLKSIERDIEQGAFVFDEALEDIHMAVEAALIERVGDAGRKLHTGRSRNDQVALDLSLWLREASLSLASKIKDLCRAFVAMAGRSGDLVMPAYTHLQRAQPIRAGAESLAWCSMLDRDADRVASAGYPTGTHDIPLGSGAVAGTSLPIDPAYTAQLLGYASPPLSGIEQTAGRDQALEFLFALSMVSMHLSRWAEQWVLYSGTEFGFIKTADRYTTGSSMMPQKRNPDMLELVRGRCGTVYGDLVALLTICKGLPIGYNRDLQEDKRVVFRAYDTVVACVTMAAAVVGGTDFAPDAITPTLDKGFLDATSLAEYLVTRGVAFRTAHRVVGSLVARCEKEGKTALSQLSLEDFEQAARSAGAPHGAVNPSVYEALGAANVAGRYKSAGAGGGQPYEQRLREWKEKLGVE